MGRARGLISLEASRADRDVRSIWGDPFNALFWAVSLDETGFRLNFNVNNQSYDSF